MPIRVQCACGKSFAVKDEWAGKAIKCPGCKAAIQVPAAGKSAPATPAKAAPQKPAGKGAAAGGPTPQRSATQRPATQRPAVGGPAPVASGGLDDLFDEEGFASSAGPRCPSCGKPVRPGAVLCTHCGVHLQTGERLTGHAEAKAASGSLGHFQLDQAVSTMRDEAELQRRTLNVGMPWWFLLIMLVFMSCFTFAAVTIVNAAVADSEATGLAASIKDAAGNKGIVWGCIITGLVLQGIARIWLSVIGFLESAGAGLTTLFLWHKFLGQLSEHPFIGLIYTLGLFTTLSGLGLYAANRWGAV